MKKVLEFLKKETVLSIAWLLALLSMLPVPPDGAYAGYVDFHTLGLLFSLMTVMAGLQGLGLFRHLGEALLKRTATTRQLEGALIFLPFFSSMAVTNDVALITFVPFAIEVLILAGQEERTIPVVAMQTIAANLGSMATPIGNPQNLYLYSHYQMSMSEFFAVTGPLTAASAVLLVIFLFTKPSRPLAIPQFFSAPMGRERRLAIYLTLFLLCLSVVADMLSVWAVTALVLLAVVLVDRPVLKRVDYSLLLTFVGFFLFVGNLGRLPLFRDFFQSILTGREVLCSVAVSQVISNVPAALLLSGFTGNASALLVGVNLGGLGTLIASMASLISFKQIAKHDGSLRGRYLLWFTLSNLLFLAVLLAVFFLLP